MQKLYQTTKTKNDKSISNRRVSQLCLYGRAERISDIGAPKYGCGVALVQVKMAFHLLASAHGTQHSSFGGNVIDQPFARARALKNMSNARSLQVQIVQMWMRNIAKSNMKSYKYISKTKTRRARPMVFFAARGIFMVWTQYCRIRCRPGPDREPCF